MAAALAAWAATARPLQYAEPPLLPKCTRLKLLGEGVVGLSYLESRDGWPVPIHAVKYIPAQAVAEVRTARHRTRASAARHPRHAAQRAPTAAARAPQ